jgi:hypothetical protein
VKRRYFLVAPLAAGAAWFGAQAMAYDERVWLEQFSLLRSHMARHYANLDWMVQHRRADLPALTEETERQIRSAVIPWQASRALKRFIESFRDPHLRMVAFEPAHGSATAPAAAAPSGPPAPDTRGCKERGFRRRDRSFRFPFEQAPGWKPAGGPWFPSGTFGDVGVIRIVLFGEDGYLEACEQVGPDRVRDRLTEEVRATLAALRGHGARVLVLDITGNGGGTNWVNDVTRLVTAKPLRRRRALMMEPACDRSGIWRGEPPACAGLTGEGESTMQGEGAWDGPLAVLVDGATASASEDLVVWLKESGAAVILGERTHGAGCGYVNGGAPAHLAPIGWTVLMPNCARIMTDGTNEVEGIAPDVAISIREGSAAGRLAALQAALPR